jgi:hypothetical protein
MGKVVFDERCAATLRELLVGLPGVREGKMFGWPAFFVGRKLFACLFGEVVGVKVPADLAERLLGDQRYAPFRPYGTRTMREWVQFPAPLPETIAEHEDTLLAAYEFVAGAAAP